MSVQETLKRVGGEVKKPFKQYAQMQDAYEAAFDIEKEDYPAQHEIFDSDDDEETPESFRELLGQIYDSFNVDDPARYYGDSFRASDDEDIEETIEDVKEYGGDGVQGFVFAALAGMERYDAAAAVIQEDPEQVEADIAPKIAKYNELRQERYGLQPAELDPETQEQLDTYLDLFDPVIEAYREGGDVVDMVHAAEEAEDRFMSYMMKEAMEEAVDELFSGLEESLDEAAEEQGETGMESLFEAMQDDLEEEGLDDAIRFVDGDGDAEPDADDEDEYQH